MLSLVKILKEQVLKEINIPLIEPFPISKITKKFTKYKLEFETTSKVNDRTITYNFFVIKLESRGGETLAEGKGSIDVDGSMDISDKNKNVLGFKGLLRMYKTHFDFIKSISEEINDICENEWKVDGVIYMIRGHDKDLGKAEKKARVYDQFIDYAFDNTYEKYRKGNNFELLKYFDDDE
jgi:hypothetical protein